jgi:hypothetical protein
MTTTAEISGSWLQSPISTTKLRNINESKEAILILTSIILGSYEDLQKYYIRIGHIVRKWSR